MDTYLSKCLSRLSVKILPRCSFQMLSNAVVACEIKLVGINFEIISVFCYPNVTRLRSGLCYRKSVCLSSVCNVGAPYWGVEAFGNISSPLCTLAIFWPSRKILRRSSQGNPSSRSVKRKRGIKIERFWTYRVYLINGTTTPILKCLWNDWSRQILRGCSLYKVLAFGQTNRPASRPWKGRGRGHVTKFRFLHAMKYLRDG